MCVCMYVCMHVCMLHDCHTLSKISVQSWPAPLINCALPPGWYLVNIVILYTTPTISTGHVNIATHSTFALASDCSPKVIVSTVPCQFLWGNLEQTSSSTCHVPPTATQLVPVKHTVARVDLSIATTGKQNNLLSSPRKCIHLTLSLTSSCCPSVAWLCWQWAR